MLKRKTPLRSKKRLNQRSKKRIKEEAIYLKKRKFFLIKHPRCMIYPHLPSEHVHHVYRRGKYYLDESTWLALSALAHREVHENVRWARSMGYLKYGNPA